MPEVLSALIAFVAEHRRCGDLEGGLEGDVVWLGCTCSPGSRAPPRHCLPMMPADHRL